MAKISSAELKTKLAQYTEQLKKYENEFLINDEKIHVEEQEMLHAIQKLIDEINTKIDKNPSLSVETKTTKVDDNIARIPNIFYEGIRQLDAAAQNLSAKIEEAKQSNKLDQIKDKILAHIEKLKSNVPKLEEMFKDTNNVTKEACAKKINAFLEQLKKIGESVNGKESLIDKVIDAVVSEVVQDKISAAIEYIKQLQAKEAKIDSMLQQLG